MANYNSSHSGSTIDSAVSLVSGSKTKNYVLAAPSSANGNAAFRALAVSDIPDLTSLYGYTLVATYTSATQDLEIEFISAASVDNTSF